jgi:hypothetical protein
MTVSVIEWKSMGVEVSASIHRRSAFHDRNVDAFSGQMPSQSATTGTRADYTDIEDLVFHFSR